MTAAAGGFLTASWEIAVLFANALAASTARRRRIVRVGQAWAIIEAGERIDR